MHRDFDTPPLSTAQFTYRVLIAVGLFALAFLLWKLADVIMLVFAGILFAAALRAMADPLDRATPLSGRQSLLVVVVLLVAAIVGAMWLTGGQVGAQLGQLWQMLPGALADVRTWLDGSAFGTAVMNMGQQALEGVSGTVSSIARFASGTFGAVTDVILILFLAIYFAADPGLYRHGILHLVPASARRRVDVALDAAGKSLKRWLLGQLIAMVCVGALTGIGLTLLGVPLALSLALIAGLLEFIPIIGPFLSAIPAVLVAFTQGGQMALYVALLYLVIQQIEGNVLMPIVQKWAVSLPPALGLMGVVIFGLLFGVMGILFATPLMVVVMVMVQKLYVEAAIEQKPPQLLT